MQVKNQQLEPDMEQWIGLKLGKEHGKGLYIITCLVNLYAEYVMQNAGLDELQARIKSQENHQQPQIGR